MHMGETGNRNSALTGCMQNLTHSKPQHKGSNLEGFGVRPICSLGEHPGEVGGKQVSPWNRLAATIWGSPFALLSLPTNPRALPASQQAGTSPGISMATYGHTRPQPHPREGQRLVHESALCSQSPGGPAPPASERTSQHVAAEGPMQPTEGLPRARRSGDQAGARSWMP